MFSNAITRCAVSKALAYAQDREQFGEKIVNFQGAEWKFADMVTEIEASRGLTYRTARRAVETDRSLGALETPIAKIYSARMSERVISEALQTFGATGFQRGHPYEYLYRLQPGYRIAGGIDEIQKNTIASQWNQAGFWRSSERPQTEYPVFAAPHEGDRPSSRPLLAICAAYESVEDRPSSRSCASTRDSRKPYIGVRRADRRVGSASSSIAARMSLQADRSVSSIV